MKLKTIACLVLAFLSPSFVAYSCNMHSGIGVQIPNHNNLLTTLSNIATATAQWRLQPLYKPEIQLNLELAEKLQQTKPDFEIIFYQAIEGHYLMVSTEQAIWLQTYNKAQRPSNEDAMIISELTVFDAIIEKKLTITDALQQQLIVINGPELKQKMIYNWLVDSLS